MPAATLTTKGQVTIPKEVRDALRLNAGDRVLFLVRDDHTVEPLTGHGSLLDLAGMVRPQVQGVTLADMEQAIADGAGS